MQYKLSKALTTVDEVAEVNPLDLVSIRFIHHKDGYSYDVIGVMQDLVIAPIWDVDDDEVTTAICLVEEV